MYAKNPEKTGKKRKLIHLLTKEKLKVQRKRSKEDRDQREVSLMQTQEGWDSRGRKVWKKLNQKSRKSNKGKYEFEHTAWKKSKAKPRKIKKN